MKKILKYYLILVGVLSFSSCIYTDETYVPQAPIYYNTRTIDVISYTQQGNFININFRTLTPSNGDYYYVLAEDRFGNVLFNGRRWTKISGNDWYTPISLYVDYIYIYPNITYRCVVMSTWGNHSQEFNMYVY